MSSDEIRAVVGSVKYREKVDFYLFDASDDYVMLGEFFTSVYHLVCAMRPGSADENPVPVDEEMAVAEALLNELFDHGVQAGDLTGTGDEWFQAWPGGREAWIARIRAWTREHGDTPRVGDLGWLHDPTMQSWRGKSGYHESPDRMAPERITAHPAFSEYAGRLRAQAGRDGVVPLGLVFLSAHTVLREAVYRPAPRRTPFPTAEVLTVADLILSELFNQGLLPVEVTGTDATAWTGTPADWQLRTHRWVEQHQHLPRLGECGWLRDPASALPTVSVNARIDHVITNWEGYREAVASRLDDIDERPVAVESVFRAAGTVLRRLMIPGNQPTRSPAPEDLIHVADLILNELFDHGVVAGEPIDEESSRFRPWPGTREDWLDRIHRWVDEHDRHPRQGELADLYRPGATTAKRVVGPDVLR